MAGILAFLGDKILIIHVYMILSNSHNHTGRSRLRVAHKYCNPVRQNQQKFGTRDTACISGIVPENPGTVGRSAIPHSLLRYIIMFVYIIIIIYSCVL